MLELSSTRYWIQTDGSTKYRGLVSDQYMKMGNNCYVRAILLPLRFPISTHQLYPPRRPLHGLVASILYSSHFDRDCQQPGRKGLHYNGNGSFRSPLRDFGIFICTAF